MQRADSNLKHNKQKRGDTMTVYVAVETFQGVLDNVRAYFEESALDVEKTHGLPHLSNDCSTVQNKELALIHSQMFCIAVLARNKVSGTAPVNYRCVCFSGFSKVE